jgi:16S rRNA (adenine1518-N6/adenine1519-N6)-dimethyltransferase
VSPEIRRGSAGKLPPARRSLGQHFLASDRAAAAIADALGDLTGRHVLEVGPGRGILTAALLARGARVVGVEIDPRLAAYLRERFRAAPLEVVEADILRASLPELARERGLELPLPVAGNIPYAITSPLLRALLAAPGEVGRAVLMVQREVAERLLAEPGTAAYGSLTVGVRAVADVTPVLTLSPTKFRPPPRVWSTVVRLDPLPNGLAAGRRQALERLTKAVFAGRRKQLRRVLRNLGVEGADLERIEAELGLPLDRRPQELSVPGFVRLLDLLSVGHESAFAVVSPSGAAGGTRSRRGLKSKAP